MKLDERNATSCQPQKVRNPPQKVSNPPEKVRSPPKKVRGQPQNAPVSSPIRPRFHNILDTSGGGRCDIPIGQRRI
jgi:hypothetical protein